MKVTRILYCKASASDLDRLNSMSDSLTYLRSEIWRRYGGIKTAGKSRAVINKEIRALQFYKDIKIVGNAKCEVVNDTVINIIMYKEASKVKVRSEIAKRTTDNEERKRLFTLLKFDKWLEDKYLSRRMRKHFKHGKSTMDNQVLFMAQDQSVFVESGTAYLKLKIPNKHGSDIVLNTGCNELLEGFIDRKNLRLVIKGSTVEVHYSFDKPEGRKCGTGEIGIDKGYTEAFVDSDGEFYATDFGKITSAFSNKNKATGKVRNKLHALEKKYREQGKTAKADKIKKFNLGQIKQQARKTRIQNQLKDRAYKSVHKMCDKAQLIVSEDLTSPIKSKTNFKNMNRRLANWYKGILAQSVEEITASRKVKHVLINASYTSQMDSITNRLEGRRSGDKFYHANGEVSQADHNASRNILARKDDSDIHLYTPYREVKRILLARAVANTDNQDLSCNAPFKALSTKSELTINKQNLSGFGGLL